MTWVEGATWTYGVVLLVAFVAGGVVLHWLESRPGRDPEREAIEALRAIWERGQ